MKSRILTIALAGMLTAGTASAQELELNIVAGSPDLSSPISIHHAGDSRLFFVEQAGRIKILENGQVLSTPFLNISSIVGSGGERGLLSMAFHPDYDENGHFYVNYTNLSGDTVIARYTVSGDPNVADPGSAAVLLTITQPFGNHNGGQLQFGPDGHLYIGMGDGGSSDDPQCYSQRPDTKLGKMLRLDVNQNMETSPYHGIPADNPYVGGTEPPPEVWAFGLRNPWRFSFDRDNGDIWIADVGQNLWEEVNHIPATQHVGGINYGWAIMEGDNCFVGFNDTNCPEGLPPCDDPSLTPPVYEYANAGGRCSVTGGFVYRGNLMPSYQGMYFFGDYCSAEVFVLDPATYTSEVAIESLGFGLTTFGEDADGELYFAVGNTIYRLEEPTAATDTWRVY